LTIVVEAYGPVLVSLLKIGDMLSRFSLLIALLVPCMAQAPHTPNLDVQRAAMKKLDFLVGRWSGQARVWRGAGEPKELAQTEEATYKLDGLLLTIEGVGKAKTDSQVILQALGIISYDDAAGVYRMRAFNDGRWLETEVELEQTSKHLHWGFTFGQIKTSSILQMTESGEWTEVADVIIGSEPPRKIMDLAVRRQ
jgi:hypothetical protein